MHYLRCYPSGFIDLNEPLGSFTTWFMLHLFLVPVPKKIGTELKVVLGASTKWCVVLGAWPKTMVQNSTYKVHRRGE